MISASAIFQSIEQLINGEIGTTRTVATAALAGGHWPWHGQTLVTPRFDVQVTGNTPHESTPISAIGSRRISKLFVRIDFYYPLNANIREDKKLEVRATALLNTDMVEQALHFPGNLDTTSAGTSTDIISGLLMNLDSRLISESWENEPQELHTQITGEAWVAISQATS